jgi:hypothetical protein
MTYWKAKRTGILLLTLLVILLPTGLVAAQGEDEARVGFFEDVEIQPGSRIEVPVQIEDVQDLYAIDIEIQFDPQVIKIQDADSDADGIQPALGMFLDAGLTLFNSADNEAGVIRFVMSQINPSEPKSGDGIILVLYIEGAAEGESDLEITILDLSTRAGDAISAQSVDGKVTVSEAAAAKEATSIPVQDPTSMVIVPTSQPTERLATTPTSQPTERPETTPTKTATPTAEETEPQASQTLETLAGATEEEKDAGTPPTQAAESESEQQNTEVQTGFSLVRYWWVVALVLGIAIGLGVYLLSTRKKG